MHIRHLLFALALAAAGVVHAEPAAQGYLPRPAEFYFDADPLATRPIVVVRGDADAAAAKLIKAIARNPYAKAENAQLGRLLITGGRPELGREAYARAIARTNPSEALFRPLLWNYGWDLYRDGDAEGAFEQWRTLLTARNVTAAWMPPTLALALWSVGRRDEAVQWYAAAVRSEPAHWRTTARHAALLPDWREPELAILAEVQAAWAARPPTWP